MISPTLYHLFFHSLRADKNFADISLVTEDCRFLTAHKVVLATSSDYFKQIFEKANIPLMFMRNVKDKQLGQILDFLYNGSVNILQEDLVDILDITYILKIKGLHN